jgi:hypothetical protein
MVKLTKFLILASGLAATAFSLERARISSPINLQLTKLSAGSKAEFQHSSPSFLSAGLPNTSGVPNANFVPVVDVEDKGPLSAIWNESTKLAFYLAVWYCGNIYYNIFNKKACIALGKNAHGGSNLHWALSAVQLAVGVLLVLPMWLTGLRTAPELTPDNWKELAPVGLWASLSHAFSVLSMAVGAVSFGQIVKAGEPVFAAATNAILLKVSAHLHACSRGIGADVLGLHWHRCSLCVCILVLVILLSAIVPAGNGSTSTLILGC